MGQKNESLFFVTPSRIISIKSINFPKIPESCCTARGRSRLEVYITLQPLWRKNLMSDITRNLCAIEHRDPLASERLLPLVYDELACQSGR